MYDTKSKAECCFVHIKKKKKGFLLGSRAHALSKGLKILKGLCFLFFLVKYLPKLFKVTGH